jgi:hypothetical protein
MFRMLGINISKSFFGPAKCDAEVFIAHSGQLENFIFCLIFEIECSQDLAVAAAHLLHTERDGLAHLQ